MPETIERLDARMEGIESGIQRIESMMRDATDQLEQHRRDDRQSFERVWEKHNEVRDKHTTAIARIQGGVGVGVFALGIIQWLAGMLMRHAP